VRHSRPQAARFSHLRQRHSHCRRHSADSDFLYHSRKLPKGKEQKKSLWNLYQTLHQIFTKSRKSAEHCSADWKRIHVYQAALLSSIQKNR
jgi:hypothetical protein